MRTIIMSCMMIKSIIIFALLSQQMVYASPFFLVQAPRQQSPFLPFLGQRALPTAAPSPTPAPGLIQSPAVPPTPRIRSATRTATSMAQQRQITTIAATVQALINTLMTAKLNWFVNLITSGGQSMNQVRIMPTTATPITTLPSFVFMPPSNSPLNVSTPPAPPATTSETSTSAPAATTDSFIASTDSASAATDNPTSNPIDTTAAADTTLIPQAPTGNPVPIAVDPNFDLRRAYSETLQNGLDSGDDVEDNEDTSTVNSETESTIPNDTQNDNVRELDAADAILENDNDTDGFDENSFIKKPSPTRIPRREKKNKGRKEKEGKKKNNQRRLTSTKISSNDDDDQRSFSFSDIVGGIIDAGVITTDKSDSSDIVTDGDVIKTKKIRAKPDNLANLLRADSDTDAITTIPRVKKYKKSKKSSSKKKPKVNKKEQQEEEGGDI